jgi:DNA polymerase III gamma/tau subunit
VEGVLGLVNAQTIGKLTDFLAAHDAAGGLALINHLVADGVELGQLVDQIVAYLRGVLFMRVARAPEQLDLPQDVVALMGRQAETLTPAAILTALREFTEARAALRDQVPGVPQLPIEMAFLRGALAATVESAPMTAPRSIAHAAAIPAGPVIGQPAAPPHAAHETIKPARQPEPSSASAAPRVPTEEHSAAKPLPATRPLPAAQTAPAAPPADADLLNAAQAAWDPFIKLAGQRCGMKVQAALRGVKRLDAAGGTLVMQFSHTFSRDLVSQGENRTLVEGVWQEVLGRKVGVRCSVAGETPAAATTQSSPAGGEPDPTPVNDDEVLLGDARMLGAIVKPLI